MTHPNIFFCYKDSPQYGSIFKTYTSLVILKSKLHYTCKRKKTLFGLDIILVSLCLLISDFDSLIYFFEFTFYIAQVLTT